MMFISTVRQVGKALSLAVFAVGLINGAGARAEETPVGLNSPVTLVDYTCGDGMHFDFKQGCVTDDTKIKKEVGRSQNDRRIRRSGDHLEGGLTSHTGV